MRQFTGLNKSLGKRVKGFTATSVKVVTNSAKKKKAQEKEKGCIVCHGFLFLTTPASLAKDE